MLHKLNDQLFCINFGNLNIAVWVSIQKQLVGDFLRQELKDKFGVLGQLGKNEYFEFLGIFALNSSNDCVDFRDEGVHGGYELDDSLSLIHI